MPHEPPRPRVLIVDDAPEMRTLISRALSGHGFAADAAATLAQARALDPAGYDAVVIDAGLGTERGTDLVAELCARDPAAAAQCLVITGGTADQVPGGVAWLAKPFQLPDLVSAVQTLRRPCGPPPGPPAGGAGPAASPDQDGRDQDAPEQAGPDQAAPAAAAGEAGLAPAPAPLPGLGPAWRLLSLARLAREHDRADIAHVLHDGPVQDLTAALLELELKTAAAGPGGELSGLAARLASAGTALRWLIEQGQRRASPRAGLAAELARRAAWLPGAPEIVMPGGQPSWLGPAEIMALADLAELVLACAAPAGPVHLALRGGPGRLVLGLTVPPAITADPPGPADDAGTAGPAGTVPDPVRAALADLGCALAARITVGAGSRAWTVTIELPGWPPGRDSGPWPPAPAHAAEW